MTLTDDLHDTAAALRSGWPIANLNRARRVRAAKEQTVTAPTTNPIAAPAITLRYVEGAGHHVKRNVPSKRIKAAHRKYGAGVSLRTFARAYAKPARYRTDTLAWQASYTLIDHVATMDAAKAWLARKGL